ncbi:MAG: rRNA maturation RNase YbeY [Bacteroidia bacterium]|nr:rRNA maturation RNase YbeY [Bacteroidia bacterium]NNJ56726.1 rRNA maturation RNase YbeY [Bacteroidia bacterium]
MSSDNISTIYTQPYPQVERTFKKEYLENCFQDLHLIKPTCFVFMSDEELLEINIGSLNHDYYTDVITFDYSNDEDVSHNEVCISVDRIIENANISNVSFENELHRICIHGLLHLAGCKDDTKEAKAEMTSLENHYLDLHCST